MLRVNKYYFFEEWAYAYALSVIKLLTSLIELLTFGFIRWTFQSKLEYMIYRKHMYEWFDKYPYGDDD